jgi:hypothetical protein
VIIRRAATAATVLIGTAVPFLAVSGTAAAAPGVSGSLCSPPADTIAPVVSQVTFGHPTVDLNTGSRVQTVTVTASDTSGSGDPSGVARVFVRGSNFGTPKLKLASGTPASGDWTGRFVVSKYAHPGTYSISEIDVFDAAGNEQDYPGSGGTPESPNALSLHPADDPTFTVTGTPATPPRKQPGTLTAFSFSPTSVDTKASAHHVQVVARFTGAEPSHVSVRFSDDPDAGNVRPLYLWAVLRRHHKKWSGSVRVPRWIDTRDMRANLFVSYGPDYHPQVRNVGPKRLHRLHIPNKLHIVSSVDLRPPTLTSLSVSPSSIDSTAGAEQVTVTATATDARSGVRSIQVSGTIRHGANGVAAGSYPHAGIGFLSSDGFAVRLKKTPSGKWVGVTKIKKCVPSGTYKLTATLEDVATNGRDYSRKGLAKKALATAGITSKVHVTSEHGDAVAPYVYSAASDVANNQLDLDFSEGVVNVDTSTLTVYPLTPKSSRFTSPATIDSITCHHDTSTVACDGSAGLVTTAKLSLDLHAGTTYAVYANLNQVTTQLTDGNGNPMAWKNSATVIGT